LIRKLLHVLAFVAAGLAALGAFASQAHAEEYPCPVLSIDRLVSWHGVCLQSCHIVDKDKDKFKRCQDRCNSDFMKCDDRRKEIQKRFNGK
jgi:hypothetical protein